MNENSTIIITGAAGFIGSCMVQYLNEKGLTNLILVDKFIHSEKDRNWKRKKYQYLVDRELLLEWLDENKPKVDFVIHLGARTDTTEFDYNIHRELNVEYSQDVWNYCTANDIPLIYASSAATYGAGELGYDDDNTLLADLRPLNPYGVSKNEFDLWAVQQLNAPPFWAGLKFFNVYGPNEYHKKRMASVIFHAFNQIQKEGTVRLFKSYKPEFKDGEQLRDFIYVKDIVSVIWWIMNEFENKKITEQSPVGNGQLSSGIYNLGTGKARTFNDLVSATFAALDKEPNIVYIDMPADIKDKYQYFTEAAMLKLKHAGYSEPFTPLEEGVTDYVRNYLTNGKYY
ncbi:MAG TPA: ADP-glyceromanno-heptose 6-epimerase [Parafilimonas sp.]|nr:ADP-glyceromanno-heptose 6-epimerase [Parafilimonas sp.]